MSASLTDYRDVDAALNAVGSELVDRSNFDLQIERYRWIAREVQNVVPPGGRVADVGAAPGHVSLLLQKLGYEVTAFDYLPEKDLWEMAADSGFAGQLKKAGIKLEQWDVEVADPAEVQTSVHAGSFDAVIFTEVLEHIYRYPFASMRQIGQLLKPGGHIIVTTPNRGYLTFRLSALLALPIDVDLESLKDHFPPHMRHVHLWSASEVCDMLQDCGMQPVSSAIKSFHLFVKTPYERRISAPARMARRMLKLGLAALVSLLPALGSTVCVVARKQ